jgi:predicted transcriptional regulator
MKGLISPLSERERDSVRTKQSGKPAQNPAPIAVLIKWPAPISELGRCRTASGIGQTAFSKAVGVGQSSISRTETRTAQCHVKTVQHYLAHFGLTLAIVPIDQIRKSGSMQVIADEAVIKALAALSANCASNPLRTEEDQI